MSNWKQNTPATTKNSGNCKLYQQKQQKTLIEPANEPLLDGVVHENDKSSQHEAFQSHLTKQNEILICVRAREWLKCKSILQWHEQNNNMYIESFALQIQIRLREIGTAKEGFQWEWKCAEQSTDLIDFYFHFTLFN